MFGKTLRLTAALAAVSALGAPASRATATPLPTDDEVQSLVDAGDFRSAADRLERLVALKGEAAAHNDRFRDLMLLVDCRLQLRQAPQLAKVLQAAVGCAQDQHDLDGLGQAAQLQLALAASRDWVYSPASDRRAKYELTDAAQRRAAAPLVLAEANAAVQEQWRQARGQRDLGPIVDVAARFALVRAAEHALTGGTSGADRLGADIEREASAMITQKLVTLGREVEHARRTAREMVTQQVLGRRGRLRQVRRRRGLTPGETADLRRVEAYCAKLSGQIDAMNRGLAAPLKLGKAAPTADDVRQRAADLLNDLANDAAAAN